MEKPFQGLATFLKSPIADMSRNIGVVGVPHDGATSFRPGARFAPNAIRQASMMLTDGGHPIFETVAADFATDFADIPVSNINVSDSLAEIENYVFDHPFAKDAKKMLMFMGGDHTISLPILRGLCQAKREAPVLVIFDAHCDTWADHFGEPIGHGTWVRNIVDDRYVSPTDVIQIGIRSPVDPETRDWLPRQGGHVFSARDALEKGSRVIAGYITRVALRRPVYISFDIDALDPAYAPGTGTPEIAGLTPHFVLDVLENISHLNIMGMDVVEVNPSFDPTQTTALTAATLLWTVASMKAREWL